MLTSRRCSPLLVAAALAPLLLACDRKTPTHRGRSAPVCATQDCATGRMLDDGCTDDGRCASCVNACPNLLGVDASLRSDTSSPDAGGRSDAALAAGPAPPALLRALAGEGTGGVFWIPAKGDFPFEDLLLSRDGQYVTHLHDHPGAFGTWRLEGDTLTLDGWMGDGQYVLRGVHVDVHELRGFAGDTAIVLHRMK